MTNGIRHDDFSDKITRSAPLRKKPKRKKAKAAGKGKPDPAAEK